MVVTRRRGLSSRVPVVLRGRVGHRGRRQANRPRIRAFDTQREARDALDAWWVTSGPVGTRKRPHAAGHVLEVVAPVHAMTLRPPRPRVAAVIDRYVTPIGGIPLATCDRPPERLYAE